MTLNFQALLAKGRAKDFGVPWSPEELEALIAISRAHNLAFSDVAPYIRTHGPLSVEDFDAIRAEEAGGEKPDAHKTRKELEKKAKALKVEFLPEITDRALADLVRKAEEAPATPAPDAPAPDAPASPDAPTDAPTDADAPLSPREELEAKAKSLGLRVTANMKDETIAAKIAEAEAADNGN